MSTLRKNDQRRLELIEDIVAHGEAVLKKHGIPVDQAHKAGVEIADRIIDSWGGQSITIPTDFARKCVERESLIFSKFDGKNYSDLSREFGYTERGMRKLLARAKDRKTTPSK